MKNLMFVILALLFVQTAQAQVKLGLRLGLSTADISTDQLRIHNAEDIETLGISVANANYGFHFGGMVQAKIGKFFIQPEVLLNTNSVDYHLEDLDDGDTYLNIVRERYQYLDIPVMMGLKFGFLRLEAGPVAHKFLNINSELEDEIPDYDPQFKKWTWAYQTGIGLDIWRFALDAKYEGSFKNYGDHFNFFGNDYQFDTKPGRFVVSLGYTF
ncbi:MAG TPA: PorT family protein [Phaeodactylibacter sp.]|nr:PorT family protein [Phaeodactylibacter sp.]